MSIPHPRQLIGPLVIAAAAAGLVSGCANRTGPALTVYQSEGFSSEDTFSRLYDAPVAATCEAARRALLSQGYVVNVRRPEALDAVKSFQPMGDVHVQIQFNVVCAPDGPQGQLSTVYVNAVQDRYTLKKSPNSASLGVAAIGSLSIPFTASDDSLVKVASETIPAGPFYDRFFALMQRYVRDQAPLLEESVTAGTAPEAAASGARPASAVAP